MSVTYSDLTNDFPDVTSDERYEFNELTIDAVPYISEYESLYSTLISATTSSARQVAWSALTAYKETDEYTTYVEPFLITAAKMQTLEDKTISAQRFAKRQGQQWIMSATQPDDNDQAVDDIWFKIITDDDNEIGFAMYYKASDGDYYPMESDAFNELTDDGAITALRVVSSLPSSTSSTTIYFVTG